VRRTFESTRDEVNRRRRINKEDLHNLKSSQSITRMIETKRMRWVGKVAHKGPMSSNPIK
jgi:hypothetical protein